MGGLEGKSGGRHDSAYGRTHLQHREWIYSISMDDMRGRPGSFPAYLLTRKFPRLFFSG